MLAFGARGEWDGTMSRRARSLEGGTLLIVGLGHIGREVAKRARAFGMRIEAVTRTPRREPLVDAVHPMPQLHARLREADAVVLCAALTPETTHVLDAVTLAACKPGALIVNVGRGGLIDHAALMLALEAGRLGGAGLDVTEPEPLPAHHPLWFCPGVIVSPHFAGGGSVASMERLATGAAANARRLLQDRPLPHRIDSETGQAVRPSPDQPAEAGHSFGRELG